VTIDVSLDTLLESSDLSIEEGKMLLDQALDSGGRQARLQAVALLSVVSKQGVKMASHCLKLAHLLGWWSPKGGLFPLAKASDKLSIESIGLVAAKLALGVAMDAGGIDDTDRVACLIEIEGKPFPVASRCLHAGMYQSCLVLGKPATKDGKALGIIGEAAAKGLAWAKQADGEAVLGDVDTQNYLSHVPTSLLLVPARPTGLVNASCHHEDGPKIPSSLLRAGLGERDRDLRDRAKAPRHKASSPLPWPAIRSIAARSNENDNGNEERNGNDETNDTNIQGTENTEGMGDTVSTSREIIRDLLAGAPKHVGLRELSIWPETIDRWVQEGYPTREVAGEDGQRKQEPVPWAEHFGYDMVEVGGWFDSLPLRGYSQVVEETDEWQVTRNGAGAAFKYWKHKYGTPEHVDFRMTSREVWERDYRPCVTSVDRERVDLEGARKRLLEQRAAGRWTAYGHLFIWENMRQSLGGVCLYTSLALDPGWIHDYARVYTHFFKEHYKLLSDEAGVPDSVCVYEDLGYHKGLFCSPNMLNELIFPYYRELVDFFHGYGLPVELHSCGNVTEALPLIVAAGFGMLNPMERKAGCDPLRFAEQFGDRLAFAGGLDVRVLESGDRDLIRREVIALVDGMKQRGGRYIFGSDHSISPLVSYASYLYALEVYREHAEY